MIYDLDPELEREPQSPKASQIEMRQQDTKLLDELDKELDVIGDPDTDSDK